MPKSKRGAEQTGSTAIIRAVLYRHWADAPNTAQADFKVGQKVFDRCTGRWAKVEKVVTDDIDGEPMTFYTLDSVPRTDNYPTCERSGFELALQETERVAEKWRTVEKRPGRVEPVPLAKPH